MTRCTECHGLKMQPHWWDSFNKFDGEVLSSFTEVSEDDIRKSIQSLQKKSCALDPIPTWLLTKCEDELIAVLTLILNTSLSCAGLPKDLKRASLTPLIKKIILDAEITKNCKPISNLSFLSKSSERILCVQLVNHLGKNGLHEVFQAACRQLHCTETALLRVQIIYFKLSIAVVVQYWCYLTSMLHLTILIMKNNWYILWHKGRLFEMVFIISEGRVQSVQVGSTFPREQKLLFGVPQGSDLGPVLSRIYTTPLG